MATVCDVAEESFQLASDVRTATSSLAAESFQFVTGMRAVVAQHVAEAFELGSDAHAGFLVSRTSESFQLHSGIAARFLNPTNVARESFRLADDMRAVSRNVVAESFKLAGTGKDLPPVQVARESFLVHGAAVPRQVALRNAAREAFYLSTRISGQQYAKLSESFQIHSALVGAQRIVNRAAESFLLNDAASQASTMSNIAAESFRVHSGARHQAETRNAALETFYLGDSIASSGGPAGGAWAANTDNFAMSRYELPVVRGLGILNGVVIAATETGFYALADRAADDVTADVTALVTGGLIDIGVPTTRDQGAEDTGDPHQKRSDGGAYIAYIGGPLRFGIGVTSSGVEERFWYDFPARTATDPTSNRAKIGRGARSRFWRFLLANMDGGSFEVKEQRVLLYSTKRRF